MTLTLVVVALHADWPTFRGNPQRTGYAPGTAAFGPSGPQILKYWFTYEPCLLNRGSHSVFDFDGDGVMDILAVETTPIHPCLTLYSGPDTAVIWAAPEQGRVFYSTPALYDATGDSIPEAFVAVAYTFTAGGVRGYDGSDGSLLWEYPTPRSVYYSSVLVVHADSSGPALAVVADDSGTLYAVNALTGALAWQFAGEVQTFSSAALGDVNGDGREEIVFVNNDNLTVLDRNGNVLWDFDHYFAQERGYPTTPALADLTGEGDPDIVFYDGYTGLVNAYRYGDTTALWRTFTEQSGPNWSASVAVGDLDGDSVPDVVWNSTDSVHAISGATGGFLWQLSPDPVSDRLYGMPTIADIDGAYYDEYTPEVIVGGSRNGNASNLLYFIDSDGTLLWDWTFLPGAQVTNEISVFDFDGDGLLEVGYLEGCGIIVILEGVDTIRSGAKGGGPAEKGSLTVSPNPVTAATIAILNLSAAGTVTARLYDAQGRLVAAPFEGEMEAGEGRIPLGISGLPEGVYILRVEAPEKSYVTKVIKGGE